MSTEEYLKITKLAIRIEDHDGHAVVIRNGEPALNPVTLAPIEPAKVVADYFSERKWIHGTEAPEDYHTIKFRVRGSGNSHPGGGLMGGRYSKLSQLHAELKAEGINLQGEQANRRIQEALKESPDMDLRS